MLYKKILITGANGTLGTELRLQLDQYKIPYVGIDREVDICNCTLLCKIILESRCDVVIHCAGLVDVPWCEDNRDKAYEVNVVGTINVAKTCQDLDKFMVFISTDYVFRGDKEYKGNGVEGNYEVEDRLDPINYYAYTKVLGDVLVRSRLDDRCMVARLSFKKKGPWSYEKAFIDQYTSRDTVDILANQILQATFGGHCGIIHLGTERKTVYELSKRQSPNVEPISISDIKNVILPKDTSLKLTKVEKVL